MATLVDALELLPREYGHLSSDEKHLVRNRYYSPGFIAVFAAYLTAKRVPQGAVVFENDMHRGYFSAVGLAKAVWGEDDYQFERKNAGVNYAMLTALASQDDVDRGTAQINSCLRQFASSAEQGYSKSPAFKELTHVVGEMHDNVWSHGLSTGFSVAQRQNIKNKTDDHIVEFSLADCGMGFLAELRRSRIPGIATHKQAIEWCIQEGNSSKLAQREDDWAQAVPNDFIGRSPFGDAGVKVGGNGNHHQGLGLAKLLELAKGYQGVLNIATGDCLMMLQLNGRMLFRTLKEPWKGVAISLSIKESCLAAAKVDEAEDVKNIMDLLRG